MAVARFFVYGLLGSDYDGSPYTQSGDLVAELAMRGIRLVIEEFRADVTKTLKDGSRGKLRIDYGDPKQPDRRSLGCGSSSTAPRPPASYMAAHSSSSPLSSTRAGWSFPQASSSAQSAGHRTRDHAAKALQKLAGPHLPATLTQLEKAIAKAGAELHEAQRKAAIESPDRTDACDSTARSCPDAGADDDTAESAGDPADCGNVDDELIDEQLEGE